jgi:hypothetical protein
MPGMYRGRKSVIPLYQFWNFGAMLSSEVRNSPTHIRRSYPFAFSNSYLRRDKLPLRASHHLEDLR